MGHPAWLIDLDQVHSSFLFLIALAVLALVAGGLFRIGLVGLVMRGVCYGVRAGTRRGFLLWERLLAWATWPLFLALVVGLLVVGVGAGGLLPALRVICGLAALLMGAVAALAYMFIDLERYEVERGYKAVHNPLKGQELATHLARYGHQVSAPLLVVATAGMILGFALLNQGLYGTVGRDWFRAEGGQGGPGFVDFLANALVHLLGIVDVLNLAQSHHFLRAEYVQQARWPATGLLTGFKTFFLYVLLQQVFASVRQGKLLAETITDFWSPHEPIHDRALSALPQFGGLAIGPLLTSLRSIPSLTREQQDQLPLILATIGPSTVPALVRHLHDPHEHVRAICVATLGHLHARGAIPLMIVLGTDPSELVRRNLVEALGVLGSAGAQPTRIKRTRGRGVMGRLFRREQRVAPPPADPIGQAVVTLESALTEDSAAVRTGAALALGRIGPPAAPAAPRLILMLTDADETVRCQAAESLGKVSGEEGVTVAALTALLRDASAPVKAAAARALGALKTAAAPAVVALVPLLQDREESVRTAAAEAIAQAGPMNGEAATTLVEGLASADTVVRAQTAEALGTIGAGAEGATPALVAAMQDGNDRVRAKAAEALGKIGESAAAAAVPSLMRALRDQDNWVSAMAAEALGQMGDTADVAIPALVRSLAHLNPQVRGNAAEALGKMGTATSGARRALETACGDEDGGVRSQAVRALGMIGPATPATEQVVLAGLQDPDPLVRAASVESVGQWGQPSEAALSGLAPLLEDANDQVKVEVTRVWPRLAGATPAVIEGLCRRLLEDDSAWVQVHAALALGRLGLAAKAAGGPLLRVVRTGEVSVREQAMRAIAMIQPPEILEAFAAGLQDANGDIRMIASGGWMKATSIPEEVIPALVAALRDPETQVRANAAHALGRLDCLPAEAVPLLIDCTSDGSDALRMNAALALKTATSGAVSEAMQHLVGDTNLRIRLIAASALLSVDPSHGGASVVLKEALGAPAPRVRKAALELIDTLGTGGAGFLEDLKERGEREEEAELRAALMPILERLGGGSAK